MPSRAMGSRPPARSGWSAPAASSATTASRTRRWISRSEGMAGSRGEGAFRHSVRTRGFFQNHVERGDVVVPLDQGRLAPEALERACVERPDRLGDPAAMGVDQDLAAALLGFWGEATEMQLCNRLSGKLGDVAIAIEAEIVRAEIDIADIAQQLAAGAI